MYKSFTNRLIDVFLSFVLLTLLSPIFFFLIIIVRLTLGKQVFFTQQRGGLNGTIFNIIKFKTMIDAYDEQGNLLPDEKRLTKIGSLLRQFSLDELPALFNVLRGEMSLVGPRPFIAEYLPHYNEHQQQRHLVKPGITGWAQIKGRNALSWEEKFTLDIWYVDNKSFLLDIKILFLTIKTVIKRDGINSSKNITMPKFTNDSKLPPA